MTCPTALYRHYDEAGTLLYVGISENPRRRLAEHKSISRWADQIADVSVTWLRSREEAVEAEAVAIRDEHPLFNGGKIRRGEPTGDELRDWMAETGISRSDIADAYGLHPSAITEMFKGRRRASLRFAVFVEDLSGGAVPVRYWLFGATAEQHGRAQRSAEATGDAA